MLRVLSVEEAVESRQRLLKEVSTALLERHPNGFPRNHRLYNALLHVMNLWKDDL